MKSYVVISTSDCGTFCMGIYKDFYAAVGRVMCLIYDFKESYKGEGDEFSYTDLEEDEGQVGWLIRVSFKKACWEHGEEEIYYILENNDKNEGKE